MNANKASASSIPSTSSSLRPRNQRLISGLSGGDEVTANPAAVRTARIASPLPSPWTSRSASPIPQARLSRPTSSRGPQSGIAADPSGRASNVSEVQAARRRDARNLSPASMAAFWGDSWKSLQGIATELLNQDAARQASDRSARVRQSSESPDSKRPSTTVPPTQWGPTAGTGHAATGAIGEGRKQQQIAALRAQKRQDILTTQESSYVDTLGRFKRRISEDRASTSAPPIDNEDRDILVYVHHVKQDDTLAGLTLKYNCSANTLRKANRMWPNDTVQMRPIIILPIDACGVKAKLVPGPEEVDAAAFSSEALPAGETVELPIYETPLVHTDAVHQRTSSTSIQTTSRPSSSLDPEPPWHHHYWVLLPGSTKPVEIGRLPRRLLGYFPPARRKSNCYSDWNTPSTSLDLTRDLTNELSSQPALSPDRHSSHQRPVRSRQPSNAHNAYFPSYLAGPGGVGTMDRTVNFPGPAQDSLNKMFARHLPDVAPPRNHQALLAPELPLYTDELTPVVSGTTTPNVVGNMNLEHVGGVIESWMRRMATNAKNAMESVERQRAARESVGAPGPGAGGIGDLIEMTDDFDIGDDDEIEEEQRGRHGSTIRVGQPSSTATSYFGGGVRGRGKSDRHNSKAGKVD